MSHPLEKNLIETTSKSSLKSVSAEIQDIAYPSFEADIDNVTYKPIMEVMFSYPSPADKMNLILLVSRGDDPDAAQQSLAVSDISRINYSWRVQLGSVDYEPAFIDGTGVYNIWAVLENKDGVRTQPGIPLSYNYNPPKIPWPVPHITETTMVTMPAPKLTLKASTAGHPFGSMTQIFYVHMGLNADFLPQEENMAFASTTWGDGFVYIAPADDSFPHFRDQYTRIVGHKPQVGDVFYLKARTGSFAPKMFPSEHSESSNTFKVIVLN
ncbi:hypothetical protein [Enterobacter bugandensis]|uniref:hypothetical protein n=1 Tax=Enterobacter bugandensis TaxID=881260 RepID=UPI0006656210|nr:hypothetical protein [Enterobacter bugandensis]